MGTIPSENKRQQKIVQEVALKSEISLSPLSAGWKSQDGLAVALTSW